MKNNKIVIYLAGPMADVSDKEANAWRDELSSKLPSIEFLNPMTRNARGMKMDKETICWVVEGDKTDILDSDAVVVNYSIASTGTAMEIQFSFDRFIPVYVITDKSDDEVSPWIHYHATKMFKNVDEFVSYMKVNYADV